MLALKTNPGIAINDAQLLAVEVSAKSRIGKGKMRLRVGNSNTGWKLVGGSEKTYNSNEPDSFVTIKFRSPQAGEKKVWQLFVNGYIKIRKIILYTAGGKSTDGQSI